MPLQSHLEFSTKAEELKAIIIADQQACTLLGNTVLGDAQLRFYTYDASSSAAADDDNVIRPDSISVGSPGRYIKRALQTPTNGTVTSVALTSADITVTGSPITTSGTIALTLPNTGVTAGDYDIVTVGAKGLVTAGRNKSQTPVTPTLNSSAKISTTRDADVNYSVRISVTSTLVGTNSGTIFLEISSDNVSFTTISQSELSVSGVVSTIANTQTVGGFMPRNFWRRIRTAQSGVNGATFTSQTGQETTY